MPHEPTVHPVQLVGAGPGSADLLTLRAARLIEGAQALLYDALVGEEIVAMAPKGCVKILTGKRGGGASMPQDAINRLMVRLARRGLRVVRLKGGDPSVFGRVGEEVAALRRQGLAVEIVPGVTAACAAAAQFALPLTHRATARRLVMATATTRTGEIAVDWAAAADPEATLALYMGARLASQLARELISAGRTGRTPVAVIQNASAPDARLWTSTLEALSASPPIPTGAGPVLILVGHALTASETWRSGGALVASRSLPLAS